MQTYPWVGIFLFALSVSTPVMAADDAQPSNHPEPAAEGLTQTIVQIGGRFCEYHRKDVEQALRGHEAVQSIEFLNDHGTVLIRYEADGVPSDRLAETAAQAAFGTGCRAWVDQGGPAMPRS
ncbi:exported protein of unknown function [Nitrospira japonica]|uniref:HMA domain-containing protein n=1 Tax=Nitrospira japonica TaxID=1325564 RepID=A0A1W1I493_9BACT|nr:cation transporter [Nitrospira japonica]SLM47824.1 exported protein of unknown function [Nitrospira japonica]